MVIENLEIADGIRIALCEIPEVLEFSGRREMHQLEQVRSESRHREIVVENWMVSELFGEGCRLCHHESGAPFLEGESAELPEISISHSRGRVVIAYAQKRIGVDIEELSERVLRVCPRVMSRGEMRFIGSSVSMATLAWTAKEALFKLLPEDGIDFRENLCLNLSMVDVARSRNEYEATAYGRIYRMVSFLREDDTFLTLAYE